MTDEEMTGQSTEGTEGKASDPTPERERPDWRRPVVTRFSLEQTLFASGSNIDGHGGSTPG